MTPIPLPPSFDLDDAKAVVKRHVEFDILDAEHEATLISGRKIDDPIAFEDSDDLESEAYIAWPRARVNRSK